MYPEILALHSIFRWLVLATLLFGIYKGYKGWFGNNPFSKSDNFIRHWTATIAQIQLIIGVTLYSISPIVHYFLHHFKTGVREREIRFFGMEHSVMMLLAIIVITIGSMSAKRKPTDKEKFKTMAIWFSIGLFIILTSIPWPFDPPPFISRPFFRPF